MEVLTVSDDFEILRHKYNWSWQSAEQVHTGFITTWFSTLMSSQPLPPQNTEEYLDVQCRCDSYEIAFVNLWG